MCLLFNQLFSGWGCLWYTPVTKKTLHETNTQDMTTYVPLIVFIHPIKEVDHRVLQQTEK